MDAGEVWETSLNSAVGAVHLGPCFLDQDWPDLSTMAGAEGNLLGVLVDWHKVINDDWSLDPVDVHEDAVDA